LVPVVRIIHEKRLNRAGAHHDVVQFQITVAEALAVEFFNLFENVFHQPPKANEHRRIGLLRNAQAPVRWFDIGEWGEFAQRLAGYERGSERVAVEPDWFGCSQDLSGSAAILEFDPWIALKAPRMVGLEEVDGIPFG